MTLICKTCLVFCISSAVLSAETAIAEKIPSQCCEEDCLTRWKITAHFRCRP